MVGAMQGTIPRGSNPPASRRRKASMETAAIAALGVMGLSVAIVNQVARRVLLPPVLLYLLVGVVAGPSVLGVFDPADLHEVFRSPSRYSSRCSSSRARSRSTSSTCAASATWCATCSRSAS